MILLGVYNFLHLAAFILTWPMLICLVLARKKYRRHVPARLGFGLAKRLSSLPRLIPGKPVIWLHALSVGEVTSALPLVRGLRQNHPQARILFSASTASGLRIAREQAAPFVDLVIAGPFDLLPVLLHYIGQIRPDLFCLIETDFWPNWLYLLKHSGCRIFLVNGRISAQSLRSYSRFAFFFSPLFQHFDLLAMQSEGDGKSLAAFRVPPKKIVVLGNLKYDAQIAASGSPLTRSDLGIKGDRPLWVCGSTHPGEEMLILEVMHQLEKYRAVLLLAPRNPDRAGEIAAMAAEKGLRWSLRSKNSEAGDLLILDTMGELARCYGLAQVAFIGGSLVAAGGHNPLEAAAWGVPVLFGPHMEDFQEMAQGLIACGGAQEVRSSEELRSAAGTLLSRQTEDQALARRRGQAARDFVLARQGVAGRHLEMMDRLLSS